MEAFKKVICAVLSCVVCLSAGACKKNETPGEVEVVEAKKEEFTVFIGRYDGEYEEKTVECEKDGLALMEKIAEVSGWDLTTNRFETASDGYLHIDFAAESSVKKASDNGEGHVVATILDSVKKTLSQVANWEICFSADGHDIVSFGKKIDMYEPYNIGDANKFSEADRTEFLANSLSAYYDTPHTDYVKTETINDDGHLSFVYEARDDETGEVLGVYKFSEDLGKIYEKNERGDFEQINAITPLED